MARAETKKAAHKKTENHDKKTESTILPPSSLWYTILPPLPPATNLRVPSAAQINLLIEKSASLMEKDTKVFFFCFILFLVRGDILCQGYSCWYPLGQTQCFNSTCAK